MELGQGALVLVSVWVMAGVGASVARRNWNRLSHGTLAQGGAAFMADEWHLSHEGRAAIRQAFWVVIGGLLVAEGLLFSALSIYTLLFT